MDLNELRAFLAVAETGSFAAAARLTEMPRASVRRRIDELEARAGTTLLVRTRAGATPTEAGRELARRASALLEQTQALLRALPALDGRPSRALRLVMPVGLPPALLATLFGALRHAAPDLRFEACYATAPTEDADLFIHFGEGRLGDAWLSLRLMTLREWLVASPTWLDRHGRPQTPADLANHDLLGWAAPGRPAGQWPLLNDRTFSVEPILVTPDIHLLRHLAAAGRGVALVPDAELPDPALAEHALETVLTDLVGATVPLCLSIPVALYDAPHILRVRQLLGAFTRAI